MGLIVTGGIAPNRQGKLSPFAAKLTNPLEVRRSWVAAGQLSPGLAAEDRVWMQVRVHRHVTGPVHEHGGKIVMQILHAGRYAYHPFNVAPSAIRVSCTWEEHPCLAIAS